MFMTNYELIYGSKEETSSDNVPFIKKEDMAQSEEKSKCAETAVKAAKAVVGAHIAAAKFAGGAVSKLSKKAIDYAKSDDAAEKAAFVKGKAGSIFNGLKDKATGFPSDHNNSDDETVSIINEDTIIDEYDAVSDEGIYDETKSVSESTISSAPTQLIQATDTQRQFNYEEDKKPPVVYALVGVIGVLLVGIGILGGMLLMKNKNDNSKDNTPYSENGNTSMSKSGETSKTDTVQEKDKSEEAVKVDTSEAVKHTLIAHLDNEFSKEKEQEYYLFDREVRYALYDVDADGVDELFITYRTQAENNTDIYLYKNNNYVLTESFWGGIEVCLDEKLIIVSQGGGGYAIKSFEIVDGKLAQNDEILTYASNYSHNGVSITQDEYEKLFAQYENKKSINVYENGSPVSSLVDMSSYDSSPKTNIETDPYAAIKQEIMDSVDNEHYSGKNSHIENAPDDMRFYNLSERYNMNVSSPSIYSGPSTEYSKIEVYSDFFWVYGENSDWYYVEWAEGNGAFTHCCYGYMNKSNKIVYENNKGLYNGYDYIENAPTDMTFVDNSDYNSIPHGIINTDNSGLNLRKGPGTTYDIILEIPKGEMVYVYGSTSDWCYVGFASGAGRFSHTDYGYVSREFLTIN